MVSLNNIKLLNIFERLLECLLLYCIVKEILRTFQHQFWVHVHIRR